MDIKLLAMSAANGVFVLAVLWSFFHMIGFIRWKMRDEGEVFAKVVKVLAQEPMNSREVRKQVGVSLFETPYFMLFMATLETDGFVGYGEVRKGRRTATLYYDMAPGYILAGTYR